MRIDHTLRPNVIHSNACFRGPTESGKYFNFIEEMLHDITLLGKVIDYDHVNKVGGQTDYIKDNLAIYYSGASGNAYTNVKTASKLIGTIEPIISDIDFSKNEWGAYGNCTKSANTLESAGLANPSGVAYTLAVQEGQIIYLRMFVKLLTGAADYFTIGSPNVNQGEGSLKTFKIPLGGMYIGHYIHCRHKESIAINVDVQRSTEALTSGKVNISDAFISYVGISDYHLQPLNTSIKASINVLEQEIRNVIDNI